jgi:chromosome segregation ATPase
LQRQQDFLEKTVEAEERKHQYTSRQPINDAAELTKVQGHLTQLDACVHDLVEVMRSYAPRVATMAETVWSRQQALAQRLAQSLKRQMDEARRLHEREEDLHERDRNLTIQTKRSLGVMNSDVQKLETELLTTSSKLKTAEKLNESLQGELARLREQVGDCRGATAIGYGRTHSLTHSRRLTPRECVRGWVGVCLV